MSVPSSISIALTCGFRWRPITSVSSSGNLGSLDSLKVLARCDVRRPR